MLEHANIGLPTNDFLFFAEHNKRYFEDRWYPNNIGLVTDFVLQIWHDMNVTDDKNLIFGWTVILIQL